MTTVGAVWSCYTLGVAIFLALASGLVYGVSDYVGGRASRRFSPVVLALVAELTMLTVTISTVPFIEAEGPSQAAVVWGIAAGVSGSLGVLGLYAALSKGNMTVVAPVTGIVAAVVPVVFGVATGERPSAIATAGIAIAIVSVALIGGIVGVGHQRAPLSTVLLATAVGAAFGMLFVAYSRTGDDSGVWPLLTARIGAAPLLFGALVVMERGRRSVVRPAVSRGMVIGVLVLVANGLYLLSTREGLLSIVAVLVALYPASTVALASVLDRERASRWQIAGMIVAAIAVSMITVGA